MTRLWPWLFAIQVSVASAAFAQTGSSGQPSTGDQDRETGRRSPAPRATAPEPQPWTIFGRASNGLASNVNFDQEDLGSYGLVLSGGVAYLGDDFEILYELAGHSYTNTSRWDRVSQRIEAAIERDLPGNWEFETVGQIGFKGSSEDRDIVDQDLEIMPRLEYRFSPERRLRLFTAHRLKRYNDAPDTNAVKHYVGGEFRETLGPRRHWEIGGRFETNDEALDRGDYRRWTYSLEHGIPVTERDALVMQIRYRLKRYTQRFVEAEDEDVLRTDHRFVPSIAWIRALNHRFEVRFDYTYESNYSNDPEKEYGAHLAWSSFSVRW
jgi:hypothetical protein